METKARITLKSKKDEAVRRYHPWVFSGAVKSIEGEPADGDLVEVFSNKGSFLGTGHYQQGRIAVRMLSFKDENWNLEELKNRLKNALELRHKLFSSVEEQHNIFRLVYAEGDRLPGLIIDHYGGNLVFQAHSIGMYKLRNEISEIFQELMGPALQSIYDKSAESLHIKELGNAYLFGEAGEKIFSEYGHQFEIDWVQGQKTGFFIDQRDNRKLLASYSAGKRILNTFCYSGGFSIYALKAGATEVHSVDSSAKAIDLLENNLPMNQPFAGKHESFVSDTLDYLKEHGSGYDIIVLDPPAYAKHMDARHKAVQGYKRLNAEAIRRIRPGGLLFTFSCSQVVNRELFNNTVIAACIAAGRQARILHFLSQGADHPFSAYHAEGHYLKGLVLEIE